MGHSEETKKKISKSLAGRKRPPFSKEWKTKIGKNHSKYWKGKKLSKEHIDKLSEAHKGQVSWLKGKKRLYDSPTEFKKGHEMSKEVRIKIGKALKGRKQSEEFCVKLGNRMRGKILSNETKNLISKNNGRCWLGKKRPELSGENSPNWQGGKSFEIYPLGWNITFKERIRHRDGYKCQLCGVPEMECTRKLDVHHKDYDKRNIAKDNLISLCRSCHTKTSYNRKYWAEYFKDKSNIRVNQ